MGRIVFLLLLLGLAACGRSGPGAAATDIRIPPGLEKRFWPPEGWTYGILRLPGKPELRYGVAAPKAEPRGTVIILPGYGESAETWFEAARALIAADYCVWILDAAGQGGSGRYGPRREVGRAPDFEADIEGLSVLERLVIRARTPPAVIASGAADLTALAAVERGFRPSVLILSDALGLPPPSGPWRRPERASWATANPDLRIGGPTRGWTRARRKLEDQTLAGLAAVSTPVVAITRATGVFPCERLAACREEVVATRVPYPVAADPVRGAWLAAVRRALP